MSEAQLKPPYRPKNGELYRTDEEIIANAVARVLDAPKAAPPVGQIGKIAHLAALLTLAKLVQRPQLMEGIIEMMAEETPF